MSLVEGEQPTRKYHRGFAVIFAFLVIFGLVYLLSSNSRDQNFPFRQTDNSRNTPENYLLTKSRPSEIRIASLGISSSITDLGLNPDRTLEVPSDYSKVGWYTNSPTPGELGPAIFVGHFDSPTGPAIFYKLKEIKQGDRIELKREDGSLAVFQVESTELFSQDKFPTETVYGPINHAGLRLITCAGTFNEDKGRYSDNLVVFAKLIK